MSFTVISKGWNCTSIKGIRYFLAHFSGVGAHIVPPGRKPRLNAGYEQRKILYNLYHILNHFNLFGGGYASQANRMIEQILR
jgi:hypothetical protein